MNFYEAYSSDEFNQANRPRYESIIDSVDTFFQREQSNIEVIEFSGIDDTMPYPILVYSHNADGFQKIKGRLLVNNLYSIAKESIDYQAYFDHADYKYSSFSIDKSTSIELTRYELHGLGLKTVAHDITIADNLITKRLNLTTIGEIIESYQEIRATKNELIRGIIQNLQTEDIFRVAKMINGLLSDKEISSLSIELLFKYRYHPNREEIYKIISESKKQANASKDLTELAYDFTRPSADDLDDLIKMLSQII
jgi:hypothetical protein